MKFSCEQCHAQYSLDDSKIDPDGVRVECKNCGSIIVVQASVESADGFSEQGVEIEGESSGAAQLDKVFDSVFGSTESEKSAVETPAARPSEASEAEPLSAALDETKIWFVAIGDVQVGPMDAQEVEERFQLGDIDLETMAWKAGMEDWAALGDLVEFTHFETGPNEDDNEHAASASAIEPKSLGNSSPQPGAISWAPSAATELAALVEEELTGVTIPESNVGENISGFSSSSAADEAAVEGEGRRIPTFRTPKSKKSSGLAIMVVGLGVLGVVGVGAWVMMSPPATSGNAPSLSPAVAASPVSAVKLTPVPAPVPVTKAEEVAPKLAIEPIPKTAPKAGKKKKRSKSKGKSRKKAKQPSTKPKRAAANSLDSVFDEKVEVKARLAKQDIVSGVRTNAKNVMVCLKKARKNGEIVPGTHKLTLDWTIRADGSVTKTKLKGPANFLGTSLPGCFEAKMRQWKFPASKQGAPIRNYPFGPFTVR